MLLQVGCMSHVIIIPLEFSWVYKYEACYPSHIITQWRSSVSLTLAQIVILKASQLFSKELRTYHSIISKEQKRERSCL